MIKNIKAIAKQPNGKKMPGIVNLYIGGQRCYKDGPSALLSIRTPGIDLEMQLSKANVLALIDDLQVKAMSWFEECEK